MIKYYQSKQSVIKARTYSRKVALARDIYSTLTKSTRRRPYIRSRFFGGKKVFLSVFWEHLAQKRRSDREKRIVFYACALDLIRNSCQAPDIVRSQKKRETYYRFYGRAKTGEEFAVQIKQSKEESKHLMSVFPL